MKHLATGLVVCAVVALTVRTEASFENHNEDLKADAFVPLPLGHSQFGLASWYGAELQGVLTASGEPYDMNGLTAAHQSLPLGSTILVTNLRNHKSLLLKVNDRGPNVTGRLLDVSKAAARRLGFSGAGLAHVRIRAVSTPNHHSATGRSAPGSCMVAQLR